MLTDFMILDLANVLAARGCSIALIRSPAGWRIEIARVKDGATVLRSVLRDELGEVLRGVERLLGCNQTEGKGQPRGNVPGSGACGEGNLFGGEQAITGRTQAQQDGREGQEGGSTAQGGTGSNDTHDADTG